MRTFAVTFATLAGTLLINFLCFSTEQVPEREKASIWMKKKQEFSQSILAALIKANYHGITEYAKAMQFLGYLEKSERADIPGYKQQLVHFETANQELIKQSRAKNLQGVTLAFNQLTVSCVKCHQLLRDTKKR